jgi:hypothetical protein
MPNPARVVNPVRPVGRSKLTTRARSGGQEPARARCAYWRTTEEPPSAYPAGAASGGWTAPTTARSPSPQRGQVTPINHHGHQQPPTWLTAATDNLVAPGYYLLTAATAGTVAAVFGRRSGRVAGARADIEAEERDPLAGSLRRGVDPPV